MEAGSNGDKLIQVVCPLIRPSLLKAIHQIDESRLIRTAYEETEHFW